MSSSSTVASAPARESAGWRWLHRLAYLSPLLIIAALLATYLSRPDFYLTYILEYQHREYQAVEMLTVAFALAAGVLLLSAAARLGAQARRAQRAAAGPLTLHQRFDLWFPCLLVLLVGLASLFLVGEELSWGQTFRYWGIAERDKPLAYETNLHNNLDLPLQSVGQIFILCVFFGLPIAWAMRGRLNLPAYWRAAIAEGPVMFAAVVAFGWKGFKELYIGIYGVVEGDVFYRDFVEQINEQKELLMALTLLLYALYRVGRARRDRFGGAGAGA